MRIDNPQESDFEQIRQAVQAGQTVTVQYVGPVYTPASLAFLNEQCKALGDKLCVRFYGHYFEAFDCAHLRHLGAVRNLYLDCLTKASNFDTLKELEYLSELSIGIFELDDMDFLLSKRCIRVYTVLFLPRAVLLTVLVSGRRHFPACSRNRSSCSAMRYRLARQG